MGNLRTRGAGIGLALLLLVGTATATLVERLDLAALADRSTVIVHGTCLSATPHWVTGHEGEVIATTYELAVTEALKGSIDGPSFSFDILTGSVDGFTYRIAGMPVLQPGEEVILFLDAVHPATGCRMPIGLSQGKFRVLTDKDTQAETVRQDAHDIVFVDPATGHILPDAESPLATEASLDEFLQRVREIVAAEEGE